MNEFDLIKNYFAAQGLNRPDVQLGIGDDAALTTVLAGHELVITTDTLVTGVHFPESTRPYDIGYKSLAVNLSDLAAMGAEPVWVTLAITLPSSDKSWIKAFCEGFFALANQHKVQLIGGDLTRGPLTITVQAMGIVPSQQALTRKKAQVGDLIYVTGTLGDPGLALKCIQEQIKLPEEDKASLLARLNHPEPRIAVGLALRGIANAAIDISDGLAADLGHILTQSQVGAIINLDQLPLSPALKRSVSSDEAFQLALTSGDDFELCFTTTTNRRSELEQKLAILPCTYTCIGTITEQKGLALRYQDGSKYHGQIRGYQHF